MEKAKKKVVVEQLQQVFAETAMVMVVRNKGITVASARGLRRKVKKAGCSYLVAKNRLAKIAATGTKYEELNGCFSGPTALAYSDDPVAIAKIISEFVKEDDKAEIVGGMMGNKLLSVEDIKMLATIPSLDELRGKIVGILQAPATRLATVLQAPAAELARVFNAYSQK